MKILVTGATSGLGRNLVEYLHQQKYQVIANGRNEKVGQILIEAGIPFFAGDLSDQKVVHQIFKDVDTVIHCAAFSSPWGKYQEFYDANVLATSNLVSASIQQKVSRFVHVSSPSIYFNFKEQLDIKEDVVLPKRFANYYVKTKWMAEQIVDKAYKENGLNTITIRPRALFGPYDRTLLPRLIELAKKGKLPLINHGDTLMDVTYVGNVVHAIEKCLIAKTICFGKKYNITNGEPLYLKDMLSKLFMVLNIPFGARGISYKLSFLLGFISEMLATLPFVNFKPSLTRYVAGVLSFGQTLDITAARKELGYTPKFSVQQGIEIYAEWLQKHENEIATI